MASVISSHSPKEAYLRSIGDYHEPQWSPPVRLLVIVGAGLRLGRRADLPPGASAQIELAQATGCSDPHHSRPPLRAWTLLHSERMAPHCLLGAGHFL